METNEMEMELEMEMETEVEIGNYRSPIYIYNNIV
jgi:hypothetical protein